MLPKPLSLPLNHEALGREGGREGGREDWRELLSNGERERKRREGGR